MSASFSPAIDALIEALRCLPSVGAKSAQRMALHLLQHDRLGADKLVQQLHHCLDVITNCKMCRTLCETEFCRFCSDPKRQGNLLCIVETPQDILAIEQTAQFNGVYFVLMGHLSPLDGIGPAELGLDQLEHRLQQQSVNEIIIATSVTVEGEATAHYVASMAEELSITVSQLAQGMPFGGELNGIDYNTLSRAFSSRKIVNH